MLTQAPPKSVLTARALRAFGTLGKKNGTKMDDDMMVSLYDHQAKHSFSFQAFRILEKRDARLQKLTKWWAALPRRDSGRNTRGAYLAARNLGKYRGIQAI